MLWVNMGRYSPFPQQASSFLIILARRYALKGRAKPVRWCAKTRLWVNFRYRRLILSSHMAQLPSLIKQSGHESNDGNKKSR